MRSQPLAEWSVFLTQAFTKIECAMRTVSAILADLQQRLHQQRERLGQFTQTTLHKKLPRRSKRIIFVATIAGRLEKTDTLSSEILAKLNAVLKLSPDDNALKFPVYLNEVVWRGKPLENLGVLEEVGTDIVKWAHETVPFWLTYGRASDMVSDAIVVKRLVEGGWSEEAVKSARHRFRSTLPFVAASSTYELSSRM
jgi:hypothetical protein